MRQIIVFIIGALASVLGLQADVSGLAEVSLASAFVWGSVELLRSGAFRAIDGAWVHVFAAAVGTVTGVAFGYVDIITGSFVDWIVFGLQAAFYGTFLDLGLRKAGALGKGETRPTS